MPRPPTPTPTLHAAARPGRSHPFDLLTLAGDGLFSWTAAMDAGVHPNVLRRALRQGELVRLRHGWYTPAASRRTPEAWHAVRLRAELAARSPGLVATHDSAMVMLGLPVRPERLSAVHLGRIGPGPIGRSVVRRAGPDPGPQPGIGRAGRACVVHRVPAGPRHDGGCVEPAFAVIQLGLDAGPREALVAADAALRVDLLTCEDLHRAADAYQRTPGIAGVRGVIAWATGRAESPGESRLRFVLRSLGHQVEVQAAVTAAGRSYRADLRIVGSRLLIEYDGVGKYDDPQELRRERSREASLRAEGWEFARFGAGDLDSPQLVRRHVDAALARCTRTP